MSLKKNLTANYISQIYVSAIGIVILPLYIKYMGAEAYGLIGFFTMLQAWFNLLDLGLTPTVGRETARFHGGKSSAYDYRKLFRALSSIFIFVALLGGTIIFILAKTITEHWLHLATLPIADVVFCVQIMAVSIALRWLGGLYRGVIVGSEKIVWLSLFSISMASLRFLFVFLSMHFFGFTIIVFFTHQLIVAVIECFLLICLSYHLLPSLNSIKERIGWSFSPLRSILQFSMTIAFTSCIWVVVTQSDKLILSGVLSLKEYGHFSMAVLVASGILILNGPISSTLMPRLTRLHAQGDISQLIQTYKNTTQLVSVIAGSVSIVVAFWSKSLLFAWTGDITLATEAAPILSLYAIGNGLLVVSAFPYYLQYAQGNLKYHLYGNLWMIIFLVPCVIALAYYYGGIGAGLAWIAINAIYLLLWCGYTHHKLLPGLHREWLVKDIFPIFTAAVIFNYIAHVLIGEISQQHNRVLIFIILIALGIGTLFCAVAFSQAARNVVIKK